MRIPTFRFVKGAAMVGLSFCASDTFSIEESAPFDAATELRAEAAVNAESPADEMLLAAFRAPPTHTPPPTVYNPPPRNPTPQPPTNTNNPTHSGGLPITVRPGAQNQSHGNAMGVYRATKEQRQVAEARARAFMILLRRAEAADDAANEPASGDRRLAKLQTSQSSDPQKKHKKHKRHRLHHRYIAIDTVRDKRAAPGAKRVVMLWDTQSESLVGDNAYDLKNPPPVGGTVQFETYSADYVGPGTSVPNP